MISAIFQKVKVGMGERVNRLNSSFNGLSKRRKQMSILVFGICITGISATLVIPALRSQKSQFRFKPDRIVMPYDIFMDDERSVSQDQLTPVGKMKGEIDGEFESFYVAVDREGSIYINRDIEYSERAYDKTDDWKQISREKLMEYEKDLDFIPSRSRGVRNKF
jgi:hypothetical protein